MFKLKLIKGMSYHGGIDGHIKVTKANPECIVETDEEAQSLIGSGFFSLVERVESGAEPQKDGDPHLSIDSMTVKELKEYAAEHEVDISACKNKEEIKAVISEAEQKEEQEDLFGNE